MLLSFTPRDIAILRLDNLGDAILTGGFLEALRRAWPSARITVLCSQAGYPFFARCAAINAVHALPGIGPDKTPPAEAEAILDKFNQTFGGQFDLLINPRGDADHYMAGAYAAASGTPFRLAFRQNTFPHGIDTDVAYTHLLDAPPADEHPAWIGRHILSALGLIEHMSPPSLSPSKRATDKASASLPGRRYVALGIGASAPYKIWPPENFAVVADELVRRGFQPILLGGALEGSLSVAIKRASSSTIIDLVGQTPLDELAAFIGRCAFFVGNDSAPKHIAAVMGVPVVDIVFCREGVPQFAPDIKFHALGVLSIRIKPTSDFDHDGVMAGRAIRSISPTEVLAGFDFLVAEQAKTSRRLV